MGPGCNGVVEGALSSPTLRRSPTSNNLSEANLSDLDRSVIRAVSSSSFSAYSFFRGTPSPFKNTGPSPTDLRSFILERSPCVEECEVGLDLDDCEGLIRPLVLPAVRCERSLVGSILYRPRNSGLITSKDYPALLRESNRKNRDSNLILLLKDREISEREFVDNSLFASTIEKHQVFSDLCRLSKDSLFIEEYSSFLSLVQNGNEQWAHFSVYHPSHSDPKYLAYLSLFAYLNNEISEEELLITHALASGLEEGLPYFRYRVLNQETLERHLKKYKYITEDEFLFNFHSLADFDSRSVIRRTAISYRTANGIDFHIHHEVPGNHKFMGFIDVSKPRKKESSVTILPWGLLTSFYRESFIRNFSDFEMNPPPTKHAVIFGYRKKVMDLIEGRPVSIPSPLFKGPNEVHNIRSSQVGIYVHDVLAHCVLDWMHPFANDLICLGHMILIQGREADDLELKSIGIEILDRAVLTQSESVAENVALCLKRAIHGKSDETIQRFYGTCREILSPEVLAKLID
jgi:hypothetical protein